MRIYIVGAPETGKLELARAIKDQVPHMDIFSTPIDIDAPALGQVNDYRVEISLAVDRMRASLNQDHTIYTGSLIDSVAHAAINFQAASEIFTEDELALFLMTSHVIAAMLRDSFKYDFIFFKPGFDDAFGELVEHGLLTTLDAFGVSYVELGDDNEQNVQLITDVIYGRKSGQSEDLL